MLELEIGKTYTNRWGTKIKITARKGQWFADEADNLYHPTGEYVTVVNGK